MQRIIQRTSIVLLVGLILLASSALATEQKITVLGFDNSTDFDRDQVDVLSRAIRQQIREQLPRQDYLLVTEENVFELLPDGVRLRDLIDEGAVTVGRTITADFVVTGELVEINNEYVLFASLYDMSSANLVTTIRVSAKGFAELTTRAGRQTVELIEPLVPISSTDAQNRSRRVAVLPFENLSDDDDYDWLSNGVAETVRSDLAAVSMFKAIDRRAVTQYVIRAYESEEQGGALGTAGEVGRDLGAELVLTGSYQLFADQLRITSTLFDINSNTSISSTKVTGPLNEVFALQDQLVREIVVSLGGSAETAVAPTSPKRPAKSFGAFEAFGRGVTALREGRFDEAIDLLEDCTDRDPNYIEAWAHLADAHGRKKDWKNAIKAYRKVLDLKPDDDPNRFMLAQTYQLIGKHDDASRQYMLLQANKNGISGNPGGEMLILNLAQSKQWREIVQLAPDVVFETWNNNENVFINTILGNLAVAYHNLGRHADAAFVFEIIQRDLDQGSNIHGFDAGKIAKNLRKSRSKARESGSTQNLPAEIRAYSLLIRSFGEEGDRPDRALLLKAIETCRELPGPYIQLARLSLDEDDISEEIRWYESGLPYFENDHVVLNNLAVANYKLGSFSEAVDYLEASIEHSSKSYYEARFNLGLLLWKNESIPNRMEKLKWVLPLVYRADPKKSRTNGIVDLMRHLDIPIED